MSWLYRLNRTVLAVVIGACLVALPSGTALSAGKIDAERGKQYRLTKQHGPWMIMVATFRTSDANFPTDGLTPVQAANELVYELRRAGVPAYAVSQADIRDAMSRSGFSLSNREGRDQTIDEDLSTVSVLAGNYPSPDDRTAKNTLEGIKKFNPRFIREVKEQNGFLRKTANGVIFRVTPGRMGPLAGAMFSINPLLTPEEAGRKRDNSLLLKLNSGGDVSLLDNTGKYTLVVASFFGKGKTVKNTTGMTLEEAEKNFQPSDMLDQVASSAWELARLLRQRENIEAYVWHEQYRSVVTVGAFDSPRDPRILELARKFGGKQKEDPNTHAPVHVAEWITVPRTIEPGKPVEKQWIFDLQPRIMEVPQF